MRAKILTPTKGFDTYEKLIDHYKSIGLSNDQIYNLMAGHVGLYDVAFFGHKGKQGDKAKLLYIWKLILKHN